MSGPTLLRRIFMCTLRMCPFVQMCDNTHLWGECIHCGKQAGKISREAVRRYIEAEERNRAAVTSNVRGGQE